MPQEKEQSENRKKTQKTLLIYALAFIGVVLLLVLISLFAQMRENSDLQEELQGQKTEFHGVAEKYKAMQEEHDKLIDEKEALEQELAELHEWVDPLDEWLAKSENAGKKNRLIQELIRAEALSALSELQRTWRTGTRAECRELIAEMEAAGYATYFDEQEQAEYLYIQKKSGYAD